MVWSISIERTSPISIKAPQFIVNLTILRGVTCYNDQTFARVNPVNTKIKMGKRQAVCAWVNISEN
jgi:hypothetical protein